jgi:hypothetical protein
MSDRERTNRQIELAAMLQDLLLEDFKAKLQTGEMTPTDRATLSRLLSQNGWVLDPAALPQGIEDKLTERIRPEDLDDDDIIPIRGFGT